MEEKTKFIEIESFIELLKEYNAKIINKKDNFILCKCRYGHKFKINTIDKDNLVLVEDEWCSKCKDPIFINDLLIDTNEDLNNLDSDIYIYK